LVLNQISLSVFYIVFFFFLKLKKMNPWVNAIVSFCLSFSQLSLVCFILNSEAARNPERI
jgi:hypothetical protein